MEVDDPTYPIQAINPVAVSENNELAVSSEMSNKRRRKKSIVWEHFTIETVGTGCLRACCKQCKRSFAYITGSKPAGTSHLKRHITLGICPVSRQKTEASKPSSETIPDPSKRRHRPAPRFSTAPFDHHPCNRDIARMIIQHNYPLHIVQHSGFISFVQSLQPQYSMASFHAIQEECMNMYLCEKQKLQELINGVHGRVSLALDLVTSNLDICYGLISCQFIDSEWNLHRWMLNVAMIPFPDFDFAFNEAVLSSLSDWHLENKLFSLTLSRPFSIEAPVAANLRNLLSVTNTDVFHGQLLRGYCFSHVLTVLARAALASMEAVIGQIRDTVKYVRTSETNAENFCKLKEQLQLLSATTKELTIDDRTNWSSTYQMLVAACELKEVFHCLQAIDPAYQRNPSMEEWKQVEILCLYLKLFFDAASVVKSPACPPATNVFYHEVSKIQLELKHAALSSDPFISNLTRSLQETFDKYWSECFLVLAAAIVMDPRFKMRLIEFSFSRIFGQDAVAWIKVVDDGVHALFLEYPANHPNKGSQLAEPEPEPEPTKDQDQPSSELAMEDANLCAPIKLENPEPIAVQFHHETTAKQEHEQSNVELKAVHFEKMNQKRQQEEPSYPLESQTLEASLPKMEIEDVPSSDLPFLSVGDCLVDFNIYVSETASRQQTKSELDQYLEEPLLPRLQQFDVLGWWRDNQYKYPTLSKMAADVLSIPFSTIQPDAAFDTTPSKIDSHWVSLSTATVEALICTKDWLQHKSSSSSSSPSSSLPIMPSPMVGLPISTLKSMDCMI